MRSFASTERAISLPGCGPFRAAIGAVLGLSVTACGNVVVVESNGSGGEGGGTTTTTTPTASTSSTSTSTTTTSTTSSTTSSTTITITFTPSSAPCAGSEPVLQWNGAPSGWETCPDGTIHRALAVTCDTTTEACTFDEDTISCTSDADCTEAANGRCTHSDAFSFFGPYSVCNCVYPCKDDGDCEPGYACVCNGVVGSNFLWPSCAPATCVTDADCPSGECGITSFNTGCASTIGQGCRAPDDICRLDRDCPAPDQCVIINGDGVWSCEFSTCVMPSGAPSRPTP